MPDLSSLMPKTTEWVQQTAGVGRLADAVTLLLLNYHACNDDVAQRITFLDQIEKATEEGIMSGLLSEPQFMAFKAISVAVGKQRTCIKKAGGSVSKLRAFVRPADHKQLKPLLGDAEARATTSFQTKLIDQRYWLEVMDPRHRSWGHIELKHNKVKIGGMDVFNRWVDSTSTESFWDWCTHNGYDGHDEGGVQYLAPKERWRYWIVFKPADDAPTGRGLLHRHTDGRRLELFDTRALSTDNCGDGFAVFVTSPMGAFYSNSHEVSKFHHSTFLSGQQVLAAGEWAVFNGQILFLSHKTGHYKAGPAHLRQAILLLNERTDLSKTICKLDHFDEKGNQIGRAFAWAKDVLQDAMKPRPLTMREAGQALRDIVKMDASLEPIARKLFEFGKEAMTSKIMAWTPPAGSNEEPPPT